MGAIVTERWSYPLLYCAEALPLAAIQHGSPLPGHWRECETFDLPSGVVSFVYDLRMADVYRMVVSYEYGSPPSNAAVTTHDWEWISEDPIESDSYESVEAKFDTFFATISSALASGTYVRGYRWSKWKDDWSGTDPSFRYANRALTFTGTDGLIPPQVSCAVTEETAIRRRWGRFYLPFVNASNISNGRFGNGYVDVIGAAAVTLLSTIEATWRHVTVSSKEPRLLETEFVRVDNTPDVIRSRRWSASTHRYRGAVT